MLTKMENPAVTPVHPDPNKASPLTTLLLGHTDRPAAATGGLGVLTTHTQAPVVTETTVGADLLQALQIITQLRVHAIGQDLRVFAIHNIALSVEEPRGDLVLGWALDDGDDSLELFGGEFTGAVGNLSASFLDGFCVEHPPTACSDQHRPSCRPSWSIGDRHP